MADVVITASAIIAGAGATVDRSLNAGEAITQGKVVYKSVPGGKLFLADSNGATPPEIRRPYGISLNSASPDQPLAVLRAGPLTMSGLTANTAYYLSDTPGGICPEADVGTLETQVFLGLATSTTNLNVNMQVGGTKP